MSYLLPLGIGAIGYMIFKKDYIGYNLLKGYTIIDEKLDEIFTNKGLVILDDINVENKLGDLMYKLYIYKYNNKIYRELLEINEKPFFKDPKNLDLLENYKSPILACTVIINESKEDNDITEFFNTFILPNKIININEESNIWKKLVGDELNLSNNLNFDLEWTIVDDNASFYKSKNLIINNIDSLSINT